MRLYTVPNAQEARRSVVWTIWMVGLFYLCTLVLGFGAMWLVGGKQILAAPGGGDSAVPLLAFKLGGTLLLGIVAAVAFATILAVVAGLTITASASFAHDVYADVLRRGDADPGDEVRVARITALVIGTVAVIGGIFAKDIDVAFLVGLAFAVAASANLPSILYSLFWPRFTARGALWSIYGGLVSSVGLIIFSPVVSGQAGPAGGASSSLITDPHVNFAFFPLDNPGLVSDSAGVLPRLARLGDRPTPRGLDAVCPDSGAGADRHRRGARGPLLTAGSAGAGRLRTRGSGGRSDMANHLGYGAPPTELQPRALDPGVLQVIRESAERLAELEDTFIRQLHYDVTRLIPDAAGTPAADRWAFCERMVQSLLWMAITDQPPQVIIDTLR